MASNKVHIWFDFLSIWNPFFSQSWKWLGSLQVTKFYIFLKQLYISRLKARFLCHDMNVRMRRERAKKIRVERYIKDKDKDKKNISNPGMKTGHNNQFYTLILFNWFFWFSLATIKPVWAVAYFLFSELLSHGHMQLHVINSWCNPFKHAL